MSESNYTEISIEVIRAFAWKQMDAMWHNNSGLATLNMVKFHYKDYVVVNPWMDEKTEKEVNPYLYYGKSETERFIEDAKKRIIRRK